MTRRWPALGLAVALLAGCGGAPILANDPLVYPSPPVPSERPARPADPIPIELPRDDGPHDRLTEWWYYTGHLQADDGRRFGFEAVVFRAERGPVPVAWASHVALTDERLGEFHYAQRSEVGPQVDGSPRDAAGLPQGFDLRVAGLNPALITAGAPPVAAAPWRLSGAGGTDRIEAALTPEEAAAAGADFGLALDLAPLKGPALHDDDGFVDFGQGGSSYYYSRTRLEVAGELSLDGERMTVDGIAWFDHQWGDFISVGGGWDWFAINLDDGTDLTMSVVYPPGAGDPVQYGTVVEPDGTVRHLPGDSFGIRSTSVMPSLLEDRLYPTHWFVTIPEFRGGRDLRIELIPTVTGQELDARPTTGVVYWEGSQDVSATLGLTGSVSLGGEAYVELTRY
jgi:predicted secreted hydrolase